MTHNRFIILGTGNAMVTRCYNTCFILQDHGQNLLVDAGGGNGILRQMEDAHVSFADIHHMFVTHAHTDHILGVIWVIRKIISMQMKGKYEGVFHIYSHEKVLGILRMMCQTMLTPKYYTNIDQTVLMHELTDGQQFCAASMEISCFDILSTKEKQFGFSALTSDGQRVACLGDEPYNEHSRPYVEGADWLLSEAFCLYNDRERFQPYEKSHSTALDTGRLAQQLGVKNLIIYHTEDKTLATRKANYSREAAQAFKGRIFVPDDLEVIDF